MFDAYGGHIEEDIEVLILCTSIYSFIIIYFIELYIMRSCKSDC